MNKNRGSQFRKWDLHLHSLYSHSQLSNQYNINKNNLDTMSLLIHDSM